MQCNEQQRRALDSSGCEVDFSNLMRQLYATDASIYQIVPAAVAFPRTAQQAAKIFQSAADSGLEITPRGAGTGLTGGAIGEGLIVDFARFNRQITDFNIEKRTVRVGAGVVLDQLNEFLQPQGFRFGPDVATSSRATLGGMIGNNSSGSHVNMYGTTGDHVVTLEVITVDGRVVRVGMGESGLLPQQALVERVVQEQQSEIDLRMPPGILKRWPGYGLDRCLRHPGHPLIHTLAGSEGTLAGIYSAEVKIVPLPKKKGIGLFFFASVAEAMQATVEFLDLKPAAIEHVDRILFDQTRGQLAFKAARDLLQLEAQPCESLLIVEFFEDVEERMASLAKRKLGLRQAFLTDNASMNLVWALRKAGLSLLTGCKGNAKPTTCIEDVAVRPQQLPEYVGALQGIMQRLKLKACYYGHAATGLLHVRPVLDLHSAEDLRKLRQVTDEVAAVVKQFKGSLAAEHGVGIARTEYIKDQLGEALCGAFKQIKDSFDPAGCLNPGKIISDGRFKVDTHLRMGAGYALPLPFEPILAFAAKDGSFVGNLEQCNGCGGCLKQAPVMCPTFMATGEEAMSTRGRANLIRAVLEGRGTGNNPWQAPELHMALGNCLSCKACTTECPSNVNMALLKTELLDAKNQHEGLPLAARVVSAVDLLGRLGCAWPGVTNVVTQLTPVRWVMNKLLGFSMQRSVPRYARQRFDKWFQSRSSSAGHPRGKVILWDDTFVRYHDPHIGQAAVKVLEAAGFEVTLLRDRVCCGRPAFSQGNLDKVRELGNHNLRVINQTPANIPIIFLEPSCWAMFAEDYRELKLPGAETVAPRCFLFEQFLADLLQREPEALKFTAKPGFTHLAMHVHCQSKAVCGTAPQKRLLQHLKGVNASILDTGCCGMAGAFGMMEKKYDLSVKVAQPLVEKLTRQPDSAVVVANGTSCRHQIADLTPRHPRHIAEVLAEMLPPAA
jgi:FAD/FMN-containing dehydrogenase/Fe-S oxidoreductase